MMLNIYIYKQIVILYVHNNIFLSEDSIELKPQLIGSE